MIKHLRDIAILFVALALVSPLLWAEDSNITNTGQDVVLWAYNGTLSAIFTDPTQVVYKRYRSDWHEIHWDDDVNPYPIPTEYVKDLIQRILSVEVKMSITTTSDFIDDAADTTKFMSLAKQDRGA